MTEDKRKTVNIPVTEFELDFRDIMRDIYEIVNTQALSEEKKKELIERNCVRANSMIHIACGYSQILEQLLNDYNDAEENYKNEQENLDGLLNEANVLAEGGYMHPMYELIHRSEHNTESWS